MPPRKSSQPVEIDRRKHPFKAPPCPACGFTAEIVTRTEYVLYLRCQKCAHVWSVTKPGAEPLGS